MKIDKIRIKNYRSIKDTGEISIDKLFALIGKNNVGKSAILKAIRLCLEPGSVEVKKDDFHKNTSDDIEISISISGSDIDKYKPFNNGDEIKLSISYDNLNHQYYRNGGEVNKTDIKKLPEPLVITDIRDPENEATGGNKSFLNKIFKILSKYEDENKVKEENKYRVELEKMQRERFNNISDSLTKKIQTILETEKISVLVSPIADFSRLFSYHSRLLDRNLQKEISSGVNILSCGTGLQSMFILALLETYAEVAEANDSILLIEEPEVYLHPEFQRKMFAALRNIASYNQVIYTTHSPVMISDLWLDRSIKLVVLENGESKIKDIDIEEVIDELGIKYDDILNVKKVVFVEGFEDCEIFNKISKNILKADPKRIINFIPTDSWRNIHLYACLRILFSESVKPNFCCIGDGDGLTIEQKQDYIYQKIEKKIKEFKKPTSIIEDIKDRIVILEDYAIESYFLDDNLLSNAFPNIDKEKLKRMINLYEQKYKEYKENSNLNKFQEIFKPKYLFSSRIPKEYQSIFNDENFLSTRKLLVDECEKIRKNDKSPFVYIIEKGDVSNSKLAKLTNLIEDILSDIKK